MSNSIKRCVPDLTKTRNCWRIWNDIRSSFHGLNWRFCCIFSAENTNLAKNCITLDFVFWNFEITTKKSWLFKFCPTQNNEDLPYWHKKCDSIFSVSIEILLWRRFCAKFSTWERRVKNKIYILYPILIFIFFYFHIHYFYYTINLISGFHK